MYPLSNERYLLKEKIKRFESGQEYQKLADENQRLQSKVERCQASHNKTKDRLEYKIQRNRILIQDNHNLRDKLKDCTNNNTVLLRDSKKSENKLTAQIQKLQRDLIKADEYGRDEHEKRLEAEKERDQYKEREERYKELYYCLLFSTGADSTNSGKTTASDSENAKAKRKKTKSHNTGNGRKKSGRKPGAQPGHPGHSRKKPQNKPQKTVECQPPKEVLDNPEDWVKTGRSKDHSSIGILLEVPLTIFRSDQWKNIKTGKTIYAPFPAGAMNEVNYDPSVRAFAALLVNYCNVSIRKASEFLYELSGGSIDLSAGFINSLKSQFSLNSKEELQEIFKELMAGPYLNADTTFTRVKGSTSYVHVSANAKNVLFQARKNKGRKAVINTPLEVYQGPVVHDSEAVYWNYGTAHQTCLVHELRYLRRSMENEPAMTWNKEMESFITRMIHDFKTNGLPAQETLEKWKAEFDQIIETGEKEYSSRGKLIWNEGQNTVKRLKKHKDSVFYFANHPGIPFHNNHAEQLGRQVKRKTKTCDHFQSEQGLSDYCDMASVLYTEKMHGRNLYSKTKEVFGRAHQKPKEPGRQRQKIG